MAKQSYNFDCGPAALRAISKYYGVGPKTEKEFIELCCAVEDKGTFPKNLVKAAKSIGLSVKMMFEMNLNKLLSTLNERKPVICPIQAWGNKKKYGKLNDGHYVVAIGFDSNNIYFEDPSMFGARGYLPRKDFMKRWVDKGYGERLPWKHLGIVVWSNKPTATFDNRIDAKKIP